MSDAATQSSLPREEVSGGAHAAAEAKSQGIILETLDAVAQAIREYGVSIDLADEARFRAAITGEPATIDLADATMHAQRAARAADALANQKLMPELEGADPAEA